MDEIPGISVGARRNEDIALDMMKFIALTTGYGRGGAARSLTLAARAAATASRGLAASWLRLPLRLSAACGLLFRCFARRWAACATSATPASGCRAAHATYAGTLAHGAAYGAGRLA